MVVTSRLWRFTIEFERDEAPIQVVRGGPSTGASSCSCDGARLLSSRYARDVGLRYGGHDDVPIGYFCFSITQRQLLRIRTG